MAFNKFETTVAGRPLVVETGKMAQLSNGSCVVRYGDTVVMTNVTASDKPREGVDFFPLSVDYEEKLYSVGKIPGGFTKREGKPADKAILTSRVIDRPIRPLFPKDLRNDVSIVSTVLCVEQDNLPEFCAMMGTAIAIAISDIPFNGPVASIYVGLVNGEYVINPTAAQREVSQMVLTVSGTRNKVCMIEAGAKEVPDDVMFDAIMLAHEEIKKLCDFVDEIANAVGKKEKIKYEAFDINHDLYDDVEAIALDDIKNALDTDDKKVRDARMLLVEEKLAAELSEKYENYDSEIGDVL